MVSKKIKIGFKDARDRVQGLHKKSPFKGETDGGKIECKLYSLSLVGFIEKAKQFFFNSSGKYIFRKGIWSSVWYIICIT